jgi:hypothetical protein
MYMMFIDLAECCWYQDWNSWDTFPGSEHCTIIGHWLENNQRMLLNWNNHMNWKVWWTRKRKRKQVGMQNIQLKIHNTASTSSTSPGRYVSSVDWAPGCKCCGPKSKSLHLLSWDWWRNSATPLLVGKNPGRGAGGWAGGGVMCVGWTGWLSCSPIRGGRGGVASP